MKKIFLFTACLSFTFLLNVKQESLAQISQEWVQRYNGPANGNDHAFSIIVDKSDNVFLTGSSEGTGTDLDFATIKYNSSGSLQWIQTYNGPDNNFDFASTIVMDDSENVYVAGGSTGIGTGSDFTTIKYNTSGQQQWIQKYNGPSDSDDAATSLALDSFGNIYVLGESKGTGTGSDIALVKYNSSGAEQWVARYNSGGDTNDYSLKVIIDQNQEACVAAYNFNSIGLESKYITLKYNNNGILQWARVYNGPVGYFNTPHDFALDDENNIYITGCSPGIGSGPYDYCTIKYNSGGDMIWLRRYNYLTTGYDVANSIAIGTSGNIYVSGFSGTTNHPGTFDYATVKYDSSGNVLWVRRYDGGNGDDRAQFVRLDSLENVYVVGRSIGTGTGVDYVTLKYDSSGQQQWTMRYNGPVNGEDIPFGAVVSGKDVIYLTGYSQGSGTGYDYATVKYSQQIGITPVSNAIPSSFALYQNYPNPFNPVTKIKFDLPQSGKTKLIVFDIMGREILRLINDELISAGTYMVELNAANFHSGVYFYRLESDKFVQTERMVLIK